ncbi:MAG: hypothetical protein CL484_12485 [Acidobacteria bacterium]|nr:hypothetical protein [Acidobacteriota bacterium]|tara:strand:- start:14535 stop:16841 length:2307 start_codon:yes stop_codon:yes gene_type:complete
MLPDKDVAVSSRNSSNIWIAVGRWIPRWQIFIRWGLLIGLTVFTWFLFTAIGDRREAMDPVSFQRADLEAVMESTGSELIQSASGAENFLLEATRQLTYADGSVRFLDGVTLQVPQLPDRESFEISGDEAAVDDTQSSVEVSGNVRFSTAGGLAARTERASFSNEQNMVIMEDDESLTTMTRPGLEASGNQVIYDRSENLIRIQGNAKVRLLSDESHAAVDISSSRAVLAQTDRLMFFQDGATVHTGSMILEADEVTAHFGEEQTALERLELLGQTRVLSSDGTLREMRANEATLLLDPVTRQPQGTDLAGNALIQMASTGQQLGSQINGEVIRVVLTPDSRNVMALDAVGNVILRLPDRLDYPSQQIRAEGLTGTGAPEIGLTSLLFDQNVEYQETLLNGSLEGSHERIVRADQLVANVEPSLESLPMAAFRGDVTFEDQTRQIESQSIEYDVLSGIITLGPDAQETPDASEAAVENIEPPVEQISRLVDATNTLEASTMTISLDGVSMAASGNLQNVLTPPSGDPTQGSHTMPALLDSTERINVSADSLSYDGITDIAIYDGDVRLWQGATSFVGESIAVDKGSGGLAVTGDVRSNIGVMRLDQAAQSVLSMTQATANSFTYHEAARHALYEGEALLLSGYGDLKADTISIFFEEDGQTLDRMEATGSVMVRLDERWATGDTLIYFESDGRYEMEGAPVEIVETVEPDESETDQPATPNQAPGPPQCRTTSGKALTFYRSTETVSMDGREQLRTESRSHPCSPLTF